MPLKLKQSVVETQHLNETLENPNWSSYDLSMFKSRKFYWQSFVFLINELHCYLFLKAS